jgi:manganese transport protein
MTGNSRNPKNTINDLHHIVPVKRRGWLRRLFAFVGPAYLVSVGYMDPGNWATDIEGGARFGYTLIWVLLMSNLMAVLLQTLSARLGIVTGYDLAQGCRREYPRALTVLLWLFAEVAIAATDLAEVIGTIIGLNLLFRLPLIWGCMVVAFDTFLLLAIQRLGIRKMEAFIVMMVGTIGACLFIEVFIARPEWSSIVRGIIPHLEPGALYVAIGIIGATVMPHNLYLHSSLVQSRVVSNTFTGKREACTFNFIDSAVALNIAFFINAAIMIMAAADFYSRGIVVTEIQQAHALLSRILGENIAPVAFAVALLAAGQSSTLTGTISGQIVMEGFLNLRMQPWLRRLLTRGMALIPAVGVIIMSGDEGIYKLLILSQVILSLQLPFAVVPLVHFTSDRSKMGDFTNPAWVKLIAWVVASIIIALNLKLVFDNMLVWQTSVSFALWFILLAGTLFLIGLLMYIIFMPIVHSRQEWQSTSQTETHALAAAIRPVSIRHIGVALEHSAGDGEIISAALSLARPYAARLTLLHVIETPGTMIYGHESKSLHGEEDEVYLESLAREIEEPELPVETMVRFGKPADEIIKAVQECGFDLLVLGSHGHQGIEDLIYGQTISRVRHAIVIPVLIVRTQGSEQAQH